MFIAPVDGGLAGVVVVVQFDEPLAVTMPPPESVAVALPSQFVVECSLLPGTV